MYEDSVQLIESPDLGNVSVCVYNEQDGLFELGERIHARYELAYMNGYNWDALIRFYVTSLDPELMEHVDTDPEAGMFAAYAEYSAENVERMKRFQQHVLKMVSDETALMKLIDANYEEIEWD